MTRIFVFSFGRLACCTLYAYVRHYEDMAVQINTGIVEWSINDWDIYWGWGTGNFMRKSHKICFPWKSGRGGWLGEVGCRWYTVDVDRSQTTSWRSGRTFNYFFVSVAWPNTHFLPRWLTGWLADTHMLDTDAACVSPYLQFSGVACSAKSHVAGSSVASLQLPV